VFLGAAAGLIYFRTCSASGGVFFCGPEQRLTASAIDPATSPLVLLSGVWNRKPFSALKIPHLIEVLPVFSRFLAFSR
jgi:hypothetical protein